VCVRARCGARSLTRCEGCGCTRSILQYRMVHCCGAPEFYLTILHDPTVRESGANRTTPNSSHCHTSVATSVWGGGSPLVRWLLTPCPAPEGRVRASVIVCISVLYLLCSVARKVLTKLDWSSCRHTSEVQRNNVVVSALCVISPAAALPCPVHYQQRCRTSPKHTLLLATTTTSSSPPPTPSFCRLIPKHTLLLATTTTSSSPPPTPSFCRLIQACSA
jgi:hypothetical protein